MSSMRMSCLLLSLLLFFVTDVNSEVEVDLVLNGYWKPIHTETNRSPVPIKVTRQCTTGLKTPTSDENVVVATHSIKVNCRGEISPGDILKGDRLKVLSIGISYIFDHVTTSKTIRGSEIHRTRQQTVEFTIPGWTKLTRWQFVTNIAGVEYDYDYMLTATNTTEIPITLNTTARVQLRKRIHFGNTRIRIRHKADRRYITLVTRYNWPAGTLGRSVLYHFILHGSGSRGIRIESLNTMYHGYKYMYSSVNGGIYFDLDRDSGSYHDQKQYWYLSKAPPLYDGDVVTFRNNYYDDSYLCHYHETKSNVNLYCIQNREDEWVLEVV